MRTIKGEEAYLNEYEDSTDAQSEFRAGHPM